ncbi:hypothetical protein ND910_08560 [Schaalia meyeri]|uniref:hypothetical protein n=1 Tax=Schaalia meyeri TaxID=52773 RepID=UPI00204404BF|nr:hypothetical protein [Schaalia meyeri]MCM3899760.1 hypothetical protein [Schaalia meyeri]
MVSSPNYERLKAFMEVARANQGLDAWDADHKKTLEGFEQAIDRLKAYRDGHGFSGKTGDAMNQWVDRSIKRIEGYRARYQRGYNGYSAGRKSMASALKEAETLSPHLLDSATSAMRFLPVVALPSSAPGGGFEAGPVRFTTGAAYVDGVEAQANAQREEASARILDMLNGKTKLFSTIVKKPNNVPWVDQDEKGDTNSGSQPSPDPWDYSPSDGYGRAGGRDPRSGAYPGGFDQPWLSEADAAAARNRTIASGALPTQELPYGEVGSRTNPITDPQDLMGTDLLHTRVNGTAYRNGVVGGHTPAPPADADHPLWRLNGGGAASSDSSVAGRLGGAGVLGAGGLGLRGAARMGSGSLGGLGSGGLGGGLRGMGGAGAAGLRGISGSTGAGGAGAAGLKVGSYSGSGFGSYKPPAGVAGANGVAGSGAAGSSGVTGTTGAGGTGGAAGAAGRGGAGAGGFMGGAGAGAGAGKQDKKSRRRKYVAFRFEDEDEDGLPAGYVNPMSQTYGSDKDIAPAKRADDGWDPRQW